MLFVGTVVCDGYFICAKLLNGRIYAYVTMVVLRYAGENDMLREYNANWKTCGVEFLKLKYLS